MKILERTHEDYMANEPCYIFNFCLMVPERQLDCFYVKDLVPIARNEHDDAVCLDSNYNCRIVNPAYQLFTCGFYPASRFMHFIEAMCDFSKMDDSLIYEGVEELVSTYFPVSWQDNFFDRLEENTSRDGFLHGKYWQDLRKRCRNFLEESGFIDHELEFVAPFKFSGFFYPDDFVDRKCHCISIYGEVASDSEWNKLKKMVRDDYAAYARKQKVTSGKNIALQGMCLPEIEG